MVRLTKLEPESLKGNEISPAMRAVLGHVFVSVPWNYMDRYIDLVLENKINIEIGIGAENLQRDQTGLICSTVARMRDKQCRFTFHGPFWDLCSGSVDPAIREVTRSRLSSLFDLAEQIRPEQILCHTGFDPRHHRGHRRTWIENSLSTLEPFVRRAEILKMPLVLENVWEEDPELHLELLDEMKSPWFGFCLDTGHQHSFSTTTMDKWLQAVWPYLKEVHIHDNDGSDDDHLPVGSGTIDFNRLFNFLREKGISPVLTVEPHTVEHLYKTLAGLAGLVSFRDFASTRRSGTFSN